MSMSNPENYLGSGMSFKEYDRLSHSMSMVGAESVNLDELQQRIEAREKLNAAAPALLAALRELEGAANDLTAAMPGSVDFEIAEQRIKRKREAARQAIWAAEG
jgi:hypothetical protein